jgi:hypothetical protein
MPHITKDQFIDQLPFIFESPKDDGTLKMIVIRPQDGQRKILDSCLLSFKGGAEGDSWARGCWKSLPDGSPDPDVQLTLMNYRVLTLLAEDDERRALAGDNLCLDFDLSEANLKSGDRLQIGEAVVEVTAVPHTGCGLFKARFGADALAVINSDQGKSLHLRGIYARVVVDGMVRTGDKVLKI